MEDIEVPDYPQLKEILLDLSCPPLWESMQKKDIDIQFIKIIKAKGLMGKYRLDVEQDSCHKITSVVSLIYGKAIEEVGLSPTDFSLCLNFMVR